VTGTFDWKAFLRRYGYYAVSFSFDGKDVSLPELAVWMRTDAPRYTGWPPFWWPTRSEIAPRVVSQKTFECLHDGTGLTGAIERWRASTIGEFTIVRAYDSDRDEEPGRYLELTMPAWRVGELVLYAGRMAERFESDSVYFTLRFEGLAGRMLRSSWAPSRILFDGHTTQAPRYERRVQLATADIETGVIEMTDDLIRGLFDLFQFSLPATLCEEEITRMRSSRY
jgi:hypothetical protein